MEAGQLVLIRDNAESEWELSIFGRTLPSGAVCLHGKRAKYCIPYKDNEYLLGIGAFPMDQSANEYDQEHRSWLEHSGLKVGGICRVEVHPAPRIPCWGGRWHKHMDDFVGCLGEVLDTGENEPAMGVMLQFGHARFRFPYYCLTVVKPRK